MLSFLYSETAKLESGERAEIAAEDASTFGFVLRENIHAQDGRATFAAAAGEWFYAPPAGRLVLRNAGVGAAEVVLVRFAESAPPVLSPVGEPSPRVRRLQHSRAWADAFAAAAGDRFAALPDARRLELLSHLYALAAAWLTQAEADEEGGKHSLLEQVERTRRRMAVRFDEPLNLEEPARLAGVSEHRFSQAFKEYTGFTPHKWLTAARLNASLSRLSNAPESIMAVAHSVGYTDELYFSRVFKKHMGLSPTDYVARANRRIVNLCPVFQGDLAALGLTPLFAPSRGWAERSPDAPARIAEAAPDIVFTHPVPDKLLGELRRIAPAVEMIRWKGVGLSWKARLLHIASALELTGVAEWWLALFETKAANARRIVQTSLGRAPFLIVGVHAGGYRVFGRQRQKMSDLFYDQLGFAAPPEAEQIGFLDTDRLDAVAELGDNALLLVPDTFSEEYGRKLAAEWNGFRPNRSRCLVVRHPDPSLYNAAFYDGLVDKTVGLLLREAGM